VSLFTTDLITRRVSPVLYFPVFAVCIGLVSPFGPPSRHSALPPGVIIRGATSIAFEENQLSPSLISLSLLSTTHPLPFQREWVRTSSQCYLTFILAMDRSLGFGSTHIDYAPYSDSVSLRLPYSVKLANASNSLTHYTKGTQSFLTELLLLVHIRFQVLFHSPLRGSFRLSLTVLVHYRSVKSI
jgi:hypothetical protein